VLTRDDDQPTGLVRGVTGDVDGDSIDDLAFLRTSSFLSDKSDPDLWELGLLLADDLSFAEQDAVLTRPGPSSAPARLAPGDLDGDGNDDLAWFEEPTSDSRRIHALLSDGHAFEQRGIGSWSCSVTCEDGRLIGYYPED
jgi:hypothetical protein